MKIGLIVYSITGNTYGVALKLQAKLTELGHEAEVIRLNVISGGKKTPEFEIIPDITSYDGLVFGTLVDGFTVSPTMKNYLLKLPSLENKKVACFVTQLFPFKFLGATQAIRKMKQMCEAKGATVVNLDVVQRMFANRCEEQKKTFIMNMSKVFDN